MQYDFSEDEVNAALQLFDAAVRKGGLENLQMASNAIALSVKFRAPFVAAAEAAQAVKSQDTPAASNDQAAAA